MTLLSVLKDEDKLVLASVKGPHAGSVLDDLAAPVSGQGSPQTRGAVRGKAIGVLNVGGGRGDDSGPFLPKLRGHVVSIVLILHFEAPKRGLHCLTLGSSSQGEAVLSVSQTLGEGRQKLARIFSEPHQAYLLTQGTS